MPRFKRLGDILIAEGVVTENQIKEAVAVQQKEGGKLGELLVRIGYVTEEQIVIALSKQLGIPYISLASGKLIPSPEQDLAELIPHEFAIRNVLLPLARNLNSLTVAMFNPLDLILIDNVKRLTSCEINPVISTKTDILKAIELFYGKGEIFRKTMETTSNAGVVATGEPRQVNDISADEGDLSLDKLVAQAEEAPVVKLVDLIIRQAIEENASDIHIEPRLDKFSLRYRVDGALYEMPAPAASLYLPIVSRIKILSKMDIAEKRLPQDGGFMVRIGEKLIDLRVSTLTTIYGEKVVIRILDKSRVPLELSKLGFLPRELEIMRKGFASSYGIVLVTGPTGSGKSTTLYAALNELNSSEQNILTIEDPVEYRLEGINQVQVRPDIGLTFANALRSFLRQDPDIILLGEVRDLETAEIAMRAALTGHLVITTLHTNDAASTVSRLIDIGLPHYLVAAALRLVVAQRLVRKLCPYCKEPVEVKNANLTPGVTINSPIIYKAKGCEKCNFIGFKGRIIISESILIDEELRALIHQAATPSQILELARKKGAITLLESGIKRVEEGITSLEEILSSVVIY